ncbi:hypothetical protein NKR19_g6375 [Coniochaeta hoffmannii]|uniref:PNPLA domain-containing protein n=1 Tax=Coniochaeta hoffmannii TaxID=91930 RepID=A0AA38VQA2_9PEZI|nr:hypothetical protein NKR19_g6375 [Coniochaeta hoffmannii]
MVKSRGTLHHLEIAQIGGAHTHPYSPTFSPSVARTYPFASGHSEGKGDLQHDSSTESSPDIPSSDEDVAPPTVSRGKGMRRLIEGFKCHECEKDLTILTGRQCNFCGGDEDPFYCVTCTEKGCMKRFCADHQTCWDTHLPGSIKQRPYHKRIDPLPQLFVDVVTHSEGDRHKQKQMHQRDEQARWFNIRRDHFHGRPDLFIYDRFIQLCDPTRSGNTDTKRHYPSFVSFVGDTSVGKSTLVRSMLLMGIANPTRYIAADDDLDPCDETALKNLVAAMDQRTSDGPVTRSEIFDHQKYPTTCGVHLYRDDGISMSPKASQGGAMGNGNPQIRDKYPILFADCEGFNAGEAMTNAERLETDDVEPSRGRDFADPRSRSPSRRRDMAQQLPVTASCYNSRGKDGIDLFYARFLYAVSDVIIFVTKDDTKIQMELTRVLEWASKAVHKSVNHPSRKTLIIVRNMANFHVPEFYDNEKLKNLYLSGHPKLWEDSEILREFVRDYNSKPDRPFVYRITTNERLYKALFNNIVCCYIPNKKSVKGRPQELFRQYQRLRDTIEASVREGLTLRAESVMQYNVPALTHILNRAFEHFTTSEQPFDFFLAARKDNPNPHSMIEHVANFLRHAFESATERTAIDVMVKDVISVALLTYTYREFSEGLGARPEEIFERELEKVCGKSIELYISQYEVCSFRFPDGQACTSRPAKLHTEHTAGKGQFEPGLFVHQRQWRSGDKRDWIAEIRQRFVESYEAIFISKDGPDRAVTPEKRLTSRRECGHSTYSPIWRNIKSNKTCLSCLQAVPDHVLTCGHSYCPRCIQELGEVFQSLECAWTMKCRLCWEAKGSNLHIVQLRPRCAGVRILTLDGGGIRGIVELVVLNALQRSVGLNLLPKDMFDLIVGTSTGGIIALALAMSNESDSIPKMMTFFADISRKTFSTSVLKKITNYAFMVLRIADSVFSADALRKGLQEHFHPHGTALFAPAMHTGIMSSGTRVAVTSARDMGQTACLITSYNHPSSPTPSGGTSLLVEREENTDKDMKIWEAALATSAAPFYLPPFEKQEIATSYVDGAVYANCPAQVAFSELERIWPDNGAPLDTLVSLGTGLQRRRPADDVPGLVNMGFFVSLRAMFQRQLDSKSSWAAFRDSHCPAAARCRLRRLDPPLGRGGRGGEDYVELWDYRKIEELQAAVSRWAESDEAAGEIEEVANTLLANLFFFEPDGAAGPSSSSTTLLSDPTLDTLPGSIRCRLGHGTPELKRLLGEMVEGFYHVQLGPSLPSNTTGGGGGGGGGAADILKEVSRVPMARWQRITARVRGRDARPGEMLVGEGGVQKFRLPYAFRVRKGGGAAATATAAHQVLGVKLGRCEQPVPISGFPTTLGELGRRAKMVWLL